MNPFKNYQRSSHHMAASVLLWVALFLLHAPAVGAQVADQDESTPTAPQDVISVEPISTELDGSVALPSSFPSISADGRYVAFSSENGNIVANDPNEDFDIFVYDNESGQTELISVGENGIPALDGSGSPAISADGRYVAFRSDAFNLVPDDTNGVTDVFVYDRQTGQTERVSVASDGTEADGPSLVNDPISMGRRAPAISADGRYVAFWSDAANLVENDTNGVSDVFVHDRQTGQTERVSVASDGAEGNNFSVYVALTADGRFVAFNSIANNLVANDSNQVSDVFVHDRQTDQTEPVSISSTGTQGNKGSTEAAISADGRYVAFASLADNLVANDTANTVDLFIHDRQTGQTDALVSAGFSIGEFYYPSISADNRFVTFVGPGEDFLQPDVYVIERETGTTELVSIDPLSQGGGYSASTPVINADGRYVAYMAAGAIWLAETDVAPPAPPAELSLNHTTGAPGSFFTVTGSGFAANSTATISSNGTVLGTLQTDADGNLTFELDTANANPGFYTLQVQVNTAVSVSFTLDPAAAVRPQQESGSLLDVPAGIARTPLYLPVIVK